MAKIVTAKEIAALLRITPTTVINSAMRGEIPAFKLGRSWRFDLEEVFKKIKTEK